TCLAQPVDQLLAHQPSRLPRNRGDDDRAHRLADGAVCAPAVEGVKAASGKRQGGNQGERVAHQATIFTRRSGTTITLRGLAPPSWRCTLSDARARASASARSRPRGALSVSRSFPLTCT